MSLLDIRGLNVYYGESHILRDVDLSVAPGQMVCLIGRNGVGKTTLLKSLMGVVPVKTGSVTVGGQDVTRATPYERVRAGIGYVPQGREIFGRLTVEDNLRMGLAGPKLLLLDEPTEGIQPSIIKDIGRVIRMLADRKTMAIVLVEQYYDFAAELADQYLVMERGEVVAQGRGADMEAHGVRQRMSI
jgi:urea transport system ATP-binding protein